MSLQERIARREAQKAAPPTTTELLGKCPKCDGDLRCQRVSAKAMLMIPHRCVNLIVRVITCTAIACDYLELPDFDGWMASA